MAARGSVVLLLILFVDYTFQRCIRHCPAECAHETIKDTSCLQCLCPPAPTEPADESFDDVEPPSPDCDCNIDENNLMRCSCNEEDTKRRNFLKPAVSGAVVRRKRSTDEGSSAEKAEVHHDSPTNETHDHADEIHDTVISDTANHDPATSDAEVPQLTSRANRKRRRETEEEAIPEVDAEAEESVSKRRKRRFKPTIKREVKKKRANKKKRNQKNKTKRKKTRKQLEEEAAAEVEAEADAASAEPAKQKKKRATRKRNQRRTDYTKLKQTRQLERDVKALHNRVVRLQQENEELTLGLLAATSDLQPLLRQLNLIVGRIANVDENPNDSKKFRNNGEEEAIIPNRDRYSKKKRGNRRRGNRRRANKRNVM